MNFSKFAPKGTMIVVGSTGGSTAPVSSELRSNALSGDLVGSNNWVIIPENANQVSVMLDATANTSGKVQYTLDRAGAIEGELTAIMDWTPGAITNEVDSAEFGRVAAIRLVSAVDNHVEEVKSSLTTALTGANNDLVFTSKLHGVAGDAITITYTDRETAQVDEVKSSLSTDLVGDDNDLVFTSKLHGVAGDAITVAYVADLATDSDLAVEVTGTDIVVTLEVADGDIATIASDITTLITATPAAHALVGVANKAANDGSGLVTVLSETALANGVDEVDMSLDIEVSGTDINIFLGADTSAAITTKASKINTLIAGLTEIKSSLTTALTGTDNDLVFTSKLHGVAGDDITVAYTDPLAVDQELAVGVVGTDIVISLATDSGGVITTTASDIATAIAATPAAHALVGVANKSDNDGSGLVTALAETGLSGGRDAVAPHPDANALVGVANAEGNTGAGVVAALETTALDNGVDFVAATLPALFVSAG